MKEERAEKDYLVSAIVSTYNSARFIRACLENLESQSISNHLEIVVVDSHSEEGEGAIVQGFQQKYANIRYIRTENREGLYAAWNRGVRSARGKYITNANTDDRLLPRALEVKARALECTNDVGLVYSDIYGTDVENDVFDPEDIDRLKRYRYPDFTPLIGLTGSIFSPQPMWRRAAHDQVGYFDETYTVAGDYEFFYRLSVRLGALHIREPLGLYLENPEGIEHSNRKLAKNEFSKLRNTFYDILPLEALFPRLPEFKDDLIAKGSVFWALGNNCMRASLGPESSRAVGYYEKAIEILGPLPALMHNIGIAHIDKGNREKGLGMLRGAGEALEGSQTLFDKLVRFGGNLTDTKMHLHQPNHPVVTDALIGRGISVDTLMDHTGEVKTERDVQEHIPTVLLMVSKPQQHLPRCMDRISRSIHSDYEIGLVVGGVKKKDRQYVERWAEKLHKYGAIRPQIVDRFNSGINRSTGDPIVILHDDVLLSADWFEPMHLALNSDDCIGIVGPMIGQHAEEFGHGQPGLTQTGDLQAKAFKNAIKYRRNPAASLSDSCIMFKRALTKRIGVFDQRLKTTALMVEDFCIRARVEGYENIVAADVMTWRDMSNQKGSLTIQDRTAFRTKWRRLKRDPSVGPKLQVMNLIERAEALMQMGEVGDALQKLTEGFRQYPFEKGLYYTMCRFLLSEEKYREAREILKAIPQTKQEEIKGDAGSCGESELKRLVLDGYCLEGMKRYEEAKNCADRAIDLKQDHPQALNLKGILAYRKDDLNEAERFFQKAVDADPGYGEPYKNLGMIYLAQEKANRALKFVEKGFVLSPAADDMAATFHSMTTGSGNLAMAEDRFKEAVMSNPNNKKLRYFLVDTLLVQGKHEAALDAVEQLMVSFNLDERLLSVALDIRKKTGPMRMPAGAKDGRTVSLCMIVKNEEGTLARCLHSAKPVVDEMIIVDTGSTDRTRDIAVIFGAKVFDFTWNGNFSDARNFSLSQASGDWIFVLDADEVISRRDYEALQTLIDDQGPQPIAYTIVTRNYVRPMNVPQWVANDDSYPEEETGSGWYPSPKVRLFTNDSRLRFQGRVHELVEPSLKAIGISPRHCSIAVHHYGKLTAEENRVKGEAYYQLGKEKFEEEGGGIDSLVELAKQASELNRHDEAIQFWQQVVTLKDDFPIAYLNMSTAYMALGNYAAGLEASKRAINLNPELKEAVLNYSTCILCAGNAHKAVLILEGFLTKLPNHPVAMALLSGAYCIAGFKEKGLKLMEQIKEMGYQCGNYISELADGLVSANRIESAVVLLEAAVESGNANTTATSLFYQCRNLLQGISAAEAQGRGGFPD